MPADIRQQLHRIIPAEIFEIDEGQGAVSALQRVVKAKIRWRQDLPVKAQIVGLRQGSLIIPTIQADPCIGERRCETGGEEMLQIAFRSEGLQGFKAPLDLI